MIKYLPAIAILATSFMSAREGTMLNNTTDIYARVNIPVSTVAGGGRYILIRSLQRQVSITFFKQPAGCCFIFLYKCLYLHDILYP